MKELIRNIHHQSHGQKGEVYFALFDKYINFSNRKGARDTYIVECAEYLNSISFNDSIINRLCEASICYCNDVLDTIGEELKYFDDLKDVLLLIDPSLLIIPDSKRNEPVVHLELNCEWEEEHGMEWIIREDRVLYVGAYNGENPWAKFTKKDSCNYA